MTELKPCPFCGGEPKIIKDTRYPGNSNGIIAYHVECAGYECPIKHADVFYCKRKRDAIKAWNTREGRK